MTCNVDTCFEPPSPWPMSYAYHSSRSGEMRWTSRYALRLCVFLTKEETPSPRTSLDLTLTCLESRIIPDLHTRPRAVPSASALLQVPLLVASFRRGHFYTRALKGGHRHGRQLSPSFLFHPQHAPYASITTRATFARIHRSRTSERLRPRTRTTVTQGHTPQGFFVNKHQLFFLPIRRRRLG